MSNLTTKQKIIFGIVIGVMLIVIGIYGYIALNEDESELDISELSSNTENNIHNVEGELSENNNLTENSEQTSRR